MLQQFIVMCEYDTLQKFRQLSQKFGEFLPTEGSVKHLVEVLKLNWNFNTSAITAIALRCMDIF